MGGTFLVRHLLGSSGYTVLEAGNGDEAVSLAHQHEGDIDLLLTDVVLPGMNGRHLADLLLGSRPHLRVIFMSGHTDEELMRQGVGKVPVDFIRKPFRLIDLSRKVSDALKVQE